MKSHSVESCGRFLARASNGVRLIHTHLDAFCLP